MNLTSYHVRQLITAVILCGMIGAAGPVARGATEDRPPNFIVIFTDDQGYGDLGCFGSKDIKTPHIDRLASEGVKLTSFYVTCGVCSPSRSSLMTGCYYKRVSVNKVLFPGEATGLNPAETTVAEVLKTRGYATACVGKWHLGDQPEFLPTRQGFDEFFGLPYSNDMHIPNKSRPYNPLPLMRQEKVVETEPDQDYLTRRYTEYAVDFIARNKDRPFFLYLPHSMPHRPCHASPEFMKRFNKEQLAKINPNDRRTRDFVYPATIEEIDWSVGRIVETLKRLGLDERTLVLFTSDNGPSAGSAGPLRGGKGSTWEGGMREPTVAWWPGRIPAGGECDEVASTIDLLPTFAKLAGAEPPKRKIDGGDIWPLLSGQPGAKSPHDAYFYYRGPALQAVRSGPWKLHQPKGRAKNPTLFNLDEDINESKNVAEEHPDVVKRLRQHIVRMEADLGKGPAAGPGVRPPGMVENPRTLTRRPGASSSAVVSGGVKTAARPPNVVVIFCDDMGYADIGPFGAKGYETPHLDRMAREGMRFTDFHVARSVCSPSRAALMTGCYPVRVGVPGNFSPKSTTGLNPDEVTIAEIVKRKNYATGMYGKWHLGHKPEFLPTAQGFDEWFGLPYSNDMWPYHPDPRYNFPDLPLMEGAKILNAAIKPKDQVRLTTRYTERAVRFIETNKDRPFLIYLPHAMPHVPLYVSDKYEGKTESGLYGDVVAEIDWGVGQILDALKRTGIDEQTLVIFTSDNGPWLLYGDRGGSAGPLREGKGTSFEGGFRVPCVMRWPGKIPAGTTCDELASTIDLLPTVAALVGAETPKDRIIDGKDIRPLMFGEKGAKSPHEVFYYYAGRSLQAVRGGKWKLVLPHKYQFPDPPGSGGKHGERGQKEIGLSLFDLDADVGEKHNLAADHLKVVERLQALAEKARADLGDANRRGSNLRPVGTSAKKAPAAPPVSAEKILAEWPTPPDADGAVTIQSLLREMIDRKETARFPASNFRLRQQSSYDRDSKTPDDPTGWFANVDRSKNFVRIEEKNGRKEWVIMEHEAPGAIVRSWMPDKRITAAGPTEVNTTLRVYLDGSDEPAIEGHMLDLFNGTGLVPPPFGHQSQASAVSFFPIPYAKSCKVTLNEPPLYFIFTHREYPAGTPVRSFTMADFNAARPAIELAGKALARPANVDEGKRVSIDAVLKPKAEASVDLPSGAVAVRTLSLRLGDYSDPQVTRSVVLKMEFDGKPTVWCPVGDFFGTGVGLHPFQGWWRTVARDGAMTCRWVMPYRESGKITLVNLHDKPVTAKLEATVGDWTWDERTMYFHAGWRHQYPVATRPFSDFNYVTLEGRGVFVGDTLTVMNPLAIWWGEGDAKIWVDGETFPSIFGTGTEDYYAYSYGGRHTAFYEHPFHAQVRVKNFDKVNLKKPPFERDTKGYSTETRTRGLDAMPFGKSLQLDMEVWHWRECDMSYAVSSYWYGFADTTTNREPAPEEAAKPIVPSPPDDAAPQAVPPRPIRKFPNAVECETAEVAAQTEGLDFVRDQNMRRWGPGRWSGGKHLFVRAAKVGDFIELRVPVQGVGSVKVAVHATKSWDYGVVRFSVNGRRAGEDFDAYAPRANPTGPIALGVFKPADGALTLRAEVVGTNPNARRPGTFFSLDCVVVEPAGQ